MTGARFAERTLVVDDFATDRLHLQQLLTARGCQVQTADSGLAAVECATSAPPDLILMDIGMPELDGLAAMRALQCDPRTRHVPVVMVSSKSDRGTQLWARLLGARGFLTKPCTAAALDAVLAELSAEAIDAVADARSCA
jgi:twitching motility two-component system response regulator PilH